MTAPSTPTPATLDAAVEAAARALAEHADVPFWFGPLDDTVSRARRETFRARARAALTAAAPILAAGHADQLAQAHAAGTAEGATAERERIALALEVEARKPLVYSQTALRAAAAIARAGASEVDR